jgi:hypothetical protein
MNTAATVTSNSDQACAAGTALKFKRAIKRATLSTKSSVSQDKSLASPTLNQKASPRSIRTSNANRFGSTIHRPFWLRRGGGPSLPSVGLAGRVYPASSSGHQEQGNEPVFGVLTVVNLAKESSEQLNEAIGGTCFTPGNGFGVPTV